MLSVVITHFDVRHVAVAKPQAVCRTYWTVDPLKIGKIGAALNWKPYYSHCSPDSLSMGHFLNR
jgi:hypothetical protein